MQNNLFKNITFLNIVLLTLIIFMANHSLMPLLHMDINYKIPSQEKVVKDAKAHQAEFSPPSPSDYVIISEENLFHPERIIPLKRKWNKNYQT